MEFNTIELKNKDARAVILTNYGANLLSFKIGDKDIIIYDKEALQNKKSTGTPVLFPTPNRVRDCLVPYGDKTVLQQKNGTPREIHGLVYDEPFLVESKTQTEAVLSIKINKDSHLYDSFPFECTLRLTYSLFESALTLKYEVVNESDSDFDFGFAFHPFFAIDDTTEVFIPANIMLDAIGCYPTKKLIPTDEAFESLSTDGRNAKGLVIDNDFTEIFSSPTLKSKSTSIEINMSEDFKHLIVFRKIDSPFICIEPQTCSVNAHNLSKEGFEKANLINLKKGESHSGFASVLVDIK